MTATTKGEERITGSTESSVRVPFRAAGMWPTAEESEMESWNNGEYYWRSEKLNKQKVFS